MRCNVRRGTGGADSSIWACFLALADSCESEALRNLNMEKRRCFGVSSCIGGESGRSMGSRTGTERAFSAAAEDEGLSCGGVTGGAGMAGVEPFAGAASASAEVWESKRNNCS